MTAGNMRKFGWKKDRYDKRDYLHKAKLVGVPEKMDLSPFLPAVRDQGNLGSCIGFGVGGNLTATAKMLNAYVEWFSPTWIYNGSRFLAGDLNYDTGAYPRDAFEWIRAKGCLLERFWPYRDVLDKTPPPSSLEPEAAKYPILEYVRVVGGVPGIASALAEGRFVSLGTPWYDAWLDIDSSGALPEINDRSLCIGGHATFLYGYDVLKAEFYGLNSWGTSWGKHGHFSMPFSAFSVFSKDGGYDAHYVRAGWSGEEDPAPAPPKKGLPWWAWLLFGAGIIGLALLVF